MQKRNDRGCTAHRSVSLPLWFVTTSVLTLMMASLMAVIMSVPDDLGNTHIRHAKPMILVGVMVLLAFLCVLFIQWMVATRVRILSSLLSEEILIVAGDPATFERLSQLPTIGVEEVNRLQIAIEQLYFGFSAELRRQGIIPHISHGEGATRGETDIGVWRTPMGNDKDVNDDVDDMEYEDSNSLDHGLDEYLLSRRYRYKQKLNSVLQIPAETGSRATTFMRGLWSTVSQPIRTCSMDADHGTSTFSVGSIRSALSPTTRSVQTRKGSFYSVQSIPSSAEGLLDEEDKSGNHTHAKDWILLFTPLTKSERDECDPLDDNTNNGFEVLANALQFENAIIFQLLKSIRVGRSLSSITLPVHILESRSLLEMLSDMFVCWDLLLPIATGEVQDPVDRMRIMLRWFLAAYHWRPRGGAKKPYNPILGEVFQCKCPSTYSWHPANTPSSTPFLDPLPQTGSTGKLEGSSDEPVCLRFIAEQVSHRPPVSVFYAELPGLIVSHGSYLPRSKLVSLNCAASISCASVVIQFPKAGCSYTFNLPNAYATGVVAGSPRLELGGVVRIEDSLSPVYAIVDFLRKGFFGGQFDEVVAKISTADGKDYTEEYAGLWHDTIMRRGTVSETLFDAAQYERERSVRCGRPFAVPIANGHAKQSRYVWREVTTAIRRQEAEVAAKAKHAVEEAQRAERRRMESEKITHTPKYFRFIGTRAVGHGDEKELGRHENWAFQARDVLFM